MKLRNIMRTLSAALLISLCTLPALGAGNTAEVSDDTSVLDAGKGVRLFFADFKTKTWEGCTFDTVFLDSAVIYAAEASKYNVSPSGDGYIVMGRNDVDYTRVYIDFNGGRGMPWNGGGCFTTAYRCAAAKGSTAETCTDLLECVLYDCPAIKVGADESDGASRADVHHPAADVTTLVSVADNWFDTSLSWEPNTEASVLNSYNLCLKSSGNQYYDNIELWYYPENAFMLNAGGRLTMITPDADTVSLPEAEGYESWRGANGTLYAAGETVRVSELAHTELTATNDHGPAYVLEAGRGIRLFFADFKTKTIDGFTYDTTLLDGASVSMLDAGSASISQYGDGYIQMKGNTAEYARVRIALGSGLKVKGGRLLAEYQAAIAKGSSSSTCTGFYDTIETGAGTLTTRHDEDCAGLIRVMDGWWDTSVTWKLPEEEMTLTSYNMYLASTVDRQYYDNIYLWYFPAGSYLLDVCGTLSLVTAHTDSVTLPTVPGYTGWLCGGRIYKAGSTVSLSKLEYQTLSATNQTAALDLAELTLTYDFENERAGSADGVIRLAFGGEDAAEAKKIELLWAAGSAEDGYKPLADYTVLYTTDGVSLEKGYVIDKNLAIPSEAAALIARVTDSVRTGDVVYVLPESKRAGTASPSNRFAVISDVHVGYAYSGGSQVALRAAHTETRTDLNAMTGLDAILICGDSTQWYGEYANENEWDVLKDYYKTFNAPVYVCKGNHDEPNYNDGYVSSQGYENFSYGYFDAFLDEWLAYNRDTGKYDISRIDGEKDYYDFDLDGIHVIFLSIPHDGRYTYGTEQLSWLDERLYENERSGKPILVLSHIPPRLTLNHMNTAWNGGATDNDAYIAVLNKHPSVLAVSGDSHYTLETVLANTVGGEGKPAFANDGAVIDAWRATDESLFNASWVRDAYNAMGLITEVYGGRIVLRGRNFTTRKWISQALTEVVYAPDFAGGSISAVKTYAGDTVTLSPVTDAAGDLRFVWDVAGKLTESETLTQDAGCTDAVALRVYDGNGYASVLYASIDEIPTAGGVSLMIKDGFVTVSGLDTGAALAAALYGEDGRLNKLTLRQIDTDTALSLDALGITPDEGQTVKAFLIDAGSLSPMAEAAALFVKTA